MIGTALEYYDYMLYMHFLFILTPLFFPSDDLLVTRLVGMASYAIGFIMRPVGGVIFGHFGDLYGRKKTLASSIIIMTLPTCFIGLLPTYAQIGLLAPILLLTCRLVQSFSLGAESIGATLFLVEHAPKNHKAFVSSFLNVGGQIGAIMGTTLGIIFTLSLAPSWGWRVPFLCGALFGWVGFYIRKNTKETPEFIKHQQNRKTPPKLPILEVLKNEKRNIICLMGISAGLAVPFATAYVYISDLLTHNLHLSPPQIMGFNTIFMIVSLGVVPLMGYLADKFSPKLILSYGAIALTLGAFPLFWYIEGTTSLYTIAVMQGFLMLITSCFCGAVCAFDVSLFSVLNRYSGTSFAWSIGVAFFGGAVMGLSVAALGLLGLGVLYIVLGGDLSTLKWGNPKLTFESFWRTEAIIPESIPDLGPVICFLVNLRF